MKKEEILSKFHELESFNQNISEFTFDHIEEVLDENDKLSLKIANVEDEVRKLRNSILLSIIAFGIVTMLIK